MHILREFVNQRPYCSEQSQEEQKQVWPATVYSATSWGRHWLLDILQMVLSPQYLNCGTPTT